VIPFLKARWEGLKKVYSTYVEQPIKLKLVEWAELSPHYLRNRFKRWLGNQYIMSRSDDFYLDLWGYFIIPIALVAFAAILVWSLRIAFSP
jgi:hypothetical protein